MNPTPVKVYSALVATMVFWGLSFVATKVALERIPTFTLVFVRFFLAALIFLVLRQGRKWPVFQGRDNVKMALLAIFEPGLYFLFETIGLQYTSAAKTALIIATIPLVVLLFSMVVLGEKTSRVRIVGILVSFGGILLLVVGDPDFRWGMKGSLLGDMLIGGAVLAGSSYIILARDLGLRYSALEITFTQIVYGAVLFSLPFLWELPTLSWSVITGRSALALVYLTVCATVGAFLCYNFALTQVPASRAAVFINGIPVVTAIGAWVLLQERLTAVQAGGGLLVLVAVFLTNLPRRHQKKA